jgi:hypothetical protein
MKGIVKTMGNKCLILGVFLASVFSLAQDQTFTQTVQVDANFINESIGTVCI